MAAIGAAWVDGAWVEASWVTGAWQQSGANATVTGALTESQVVAGGQEITITLSGDTWIADITAQRQNIIDGLNAAGERTNLLSGSQDLSQTWTNVRSVDAQAQGTAPDGTNTANKITDDSGGGTGTVYVNQVVTIADAEHTYSVHGKADQVDHMLLQHALFGQQGTTYYDVQNGTIGTSHVNHSNVAISDEGNGFYRCSFSFTPNADFLGVVRVYPIETDNVLTVDRDGTSSILMWGAQLEVGPLTAYIPTTTGPASAQAEEFGWNNEVRDKEVVTAVVRTSDTVVTITLTASAAYAIDANEIITATIPATALTGGVALAGTPTVTVTADDESEDFFGSGEDQIMDEDEMFLAIFKEFAGRLM